MSCQFHVWYLFRKGTVFRPRELFSRRRRTRQQTGPDASLPPIDRRSCIVGGGDGGAGSLRSGNNYSVAQWVRSCVMFFLPLLTSARFYAIIVGIRKNGRFFSERPEMFFLSLQIFFKISSFRPTTRSTLKCSATYSTFSPLFAKTTFTARSSLEIRSELKSSLLKERYSNVATQCRIRREWGARDSFLLRPQSPSLKQPLFSATAQLLTSCPHHPPQGTANTDRGPGPGRAEPDQIVPTVTGVTDIRNTLRVPWLP